EPGVAPRAPPPPGPGRGVAEDADEVQLGVAPAVRDGPPVVAPPPALLGIEDVLQPHHGGGGVVAAIAEPAGHQPVGQALGHRAHLGQRQAAPLGGGVVPAGPLLVGRERVARRGPPRRAGGSPPGRPPPRPWRPAPGPGGRRRPAPGPPQPYSAGRSTSSTATRPPLGWESTAASGTGTGA